jgi:hypothetical protein
MSAAPIERCGLYNQSCHDPPHSFALAQPSGSMSRIAAAVIQCITRAVTV